MALSTMNIIDLLSPNAVKVPLVATEKKAAIDELVDLLASNNLVPDAAELKRVVWDREQQRSTGIGEGLAIPHGKTSTLKQLVMAVGRPSEPISFDAIDQKPVKLLVLLASPPDKTAEHIQALGKISRMMSNPATRGMAYYSESSLELYELFRTTEQRA